MDPYTSYDALNHVPRRVGNRRRNGYELTRQRDMVPIAMGAASAAVVVHALLWMYFPSLSVLGLGSLTDVPEEVKIHDKVRVVVKEPPKEEKVEATEQEIVEQQPQEIEEIAHEPEEIDILDIDVFNTAVLQSFAEEIIFFIHLYYPSFILLYHFFNKKSNLHFWSKNF